MKKIVSALIIVCLFVSCTNRIYNSASWQSKKITIDGQIPEWPNPLRFYDQATGINYCISNDRYNLYLVCSISNDFLQTKILRSGLEFGIDTLGKKSFSVVIKYPVGTVSNPDQKPNAGAQAAVGTERRTDRSALKLKFLAEATEMQLVGFKPNLGKMISLLSPNNTGISAAINFDVNGTMNMEAVIPFSTFYKNELTPSDSNKIFNYQIKINSASKSNNGSNTGGENHSRGTRGGMGGGGMRGGGMQRSGIGGGGMRGGGMNNNRMSGENGSNSYQRNANLSGITKTTIKLKLAYRKS